MVGGKGNHEEENKKYKQLKNRLKKQKHMQEKMADE